MTFLVTVNSPILNKFVVRKYTGYGIKGADVPTTGANGGSPAVNDSLLPASEYYWRIVSGPSAGVLEIFPDLTFTWDMSGVASGQYTFVYQLYENNIALLPTATVTANVGSIRQYLRPIEDTLLGPWLMSTGAVAYDCINEETRSLTDYVQTLNAGASRYRLSSGQTPSASNNHTLNYCIDGAGGRLVVTLQQNLVDIASWEHTTLPVTPTDYNRVLTSPQVSRITDYTNLFLKLEAFAV